MARTNSVACLGDHSEQVRIAALLGMSEVAIIGWWILLRWYSVQLVWENVGRCGNIPSVSHGRAHLQVPQQ